VCGTLADTTASHHGTYIVSRTDRLYMSSARCVVLQVQQNMAAGMRRDSMHVMENLRAHAGTVTK
jgi:hypothetical protein